jgi:hypothetical protein
MDYLANHQNISNVSKIILSNKSTIKELPSLEAMPWKIFINPTFKICWSCNLVLMHQCRKLSDRQSWVQIHLQVLLQIPTETQFWFVFSYTASNQIDKSGVIHLSKGQWKQMRTLSLYKDETRKIPTKLKELALSSYARSIVPAFKYYASANLFLIQTITKLKFKTLLNWWEWMPL